MRWLGLPWALNLVTGHSGTLAAGVPLRKSTDLLTSREVEVLQLIAEGKANKQIAGGLGVGGEHQDRRDPPPTADEQIAHS